MGRDEEARAALSHAERRVARSVRDSDRVALAFSGGLASTVLAAIARKRCELACYCVAIGEAPDLRAARLAEAFLDYRVEVVRLTPTAALGRARRLARAEPALRTHEVLALLPAIVARERAEGPFLCGFTDSGPAAERVLRGHNLGVPLIRSPPAASDAGRRELSACASLLGLPSAFARCRRRSPSNGSGLGPVLRGLAAARGTGLATLLRPRSYH